MCECVGVCLRSYCGWLGVECLKTSTIRVLVLFSFLFFFFFFCCCYYCHVDVDNLQSRKLVNVYGVQRCISVIIIIYNVVCPDLSFRILGIETFFPVRHSVLVVCLLIVKLNNRYVGTDSPVGIKMKTRVREVLAEQLFAQPNAHRKGDTRF